MIGQIRYYGIDSEINSQSVAPAASSGRNYNIPGLNTENKNRQSSTVSAYDKLVQGNNTFQTINATQIIIQSIPGIRFRINGQAQNPAWSVLGPTGIFELKLNNLMKIYSLEFPEDDLKKIGSVRTQDGVPSGYIIVDYVYEGVK